MQTEVHIDHVSNINTVDASAFIGAYVHLFWTDERLKDWPLAKPLPATLWCPLLVLDNRLRQMESHTYTYLLHRDTGEVIRTIHFVGEIRNHMELKDFPFDTEDIKLEFSTKSNWSSYSEEIHGLERDDRVYTLVSRKPSKRKWVRLSGEWYKGKEGRVDEWSVLGVEASICKPSLMPLLTPHPKGQKPQLPDTALDTATNPSRIPSNYTSLTVTIEVSRKWKYYLLEVLAPLYMLTFLSTISTFSMDVDDLPARSSCVATYFVAATAMLYVVGQMLPKTDFRTAIDHVIFLTISSLVVAGAASVVLKMFVLQTYGLEEAERWNIRAAVWIILWNVVGNIARLVPPHRRQKEYTKDKQKTPTEPQADGVHYWPLQRYQQQEKELITGAQNNDPQGGRSDCMKSHECIAACVLVVSGFLTWPLSWVFIYLQIKLEESSYGSSASM
eukprot:COSAG02_NODE_19_length_53976_cov_37.338512_11_plen_444_part_00